MTTIARMQRANRGTQFRAYRLHGFDPALLDPFMGCLLYTSPSPRD